MNKDNIQSGRKWRVANIALTAILLAAICLIFGIYLYTIIAQTEIGVMPDINKRGAFALALASFAYGFMPSFAFLAAAGIASVAVVLAVSVKDLKESVQKPKEYLSCAVFAAVFCALSAAAAIAFSSWLVGFLAAVLFACAIVGFGCYRSAGRAEKTSSAENDGQKPPQSRKLKRRGVCFAVFLSVSVLMFFVVQGQYLYFGYGLFGPSAIHMIAGTGVLAAVFPCGICFCGVRAAYRFRWSFTAAAVFWFLCAALSAVPFSSSRSFLLISFAAAASYILTGILNLCAARTVRKEYKKITL